MKKVFLAVSVLWFFTIFAGLSLAADPYVLGFQSDFTGTGRTMFGPEAEGFRVYMDSLNDRGGINGHPVKVIYEDDKSDPARSNTVATKMIMEDKVLAIVGLGFSFTQPPVYRLAKEKGVPVLCGYSCSVPVYDQTKADNPWIFSAGQVYTNDYTTTVWAELKGLAKLFPVGTSYATMCYTSPGGRVITEQIAKFGVIANKWKLLYRDDIPPGTVDITPWAQKLAKANPDIGVINFAEEIIIPLIPALEKYGYTKVVHLSDAVSTKGFLKMMSGLMKERDNIYIQSYNIMEPPFGDKTVPELDVIKNATKKHGYNFEWTNRHTNGWIYGMVMEAAMKKAGWPCDRKGLLKAMENLTVDTKGLRGGPIRFTPQDHRGPEYNKEYQWDPKAKKFRTAVDWVTWSGREIAANPPK